MDEIFSTRYFRMFRLQRSYLTNMQKLLNSIHKLYSTRRVKAGKEEKIDSKLCHWKKLNMYSVALVAQLRNVIEMFSFSVYFVQPSCSDLRLFDADFGTHRSIKVITSADVVLKCYDISYALNFHMSQ